jgi:hypothetical protein
VPAVLLGLLQVAPLVRGDSALKRLFGLRHTIGSDDLLGSELQF